jgi:predicted amidophosphoribosyltransferase
MVYCSNCGSKLDDSAYFCFKCGTKTQVGKAAKVMYPYDELRDAFYTVGVELEKAFDIAARQTQAAFKKVSENMQQKTSTTQQATAQGTVVCSTCQTNNASSAVFCVNCGAKIASSGRS